MKSPPLVLGYPKARIFACYTLASERVHLVWYALTWKISCSFISELSYKELVSQYKNSQATMCETKGKNLFTPAGEPGEPLFAVYC